MKSKTKIIVPALALALAFASGVQAIGPGVDDRVLAEAADRAQLQEIAAVLADPDAREKYASVNALVDLSSKYAELPQEISDLLGAAALNRDPEIARLASDALYQLELRSKRLAEQPPETRPDDELRRLARQNEFAEIATILNDYRSPERYRAASALTELALSSETIPDDMLDLLKRIRGDDDFEIARLAESVLALHEGRSMDSSFVLAPVEPKDQPFEQKRHEDPFEGLSDANPNLRYDALVYLLEITPKDGNPDPEILKAFADAKNDPNPKVRSFAEFAIGGGLAGDENALAQVYVGWTDPAAADDLQPPSPEYAEAKQSYGNLNEYGVFSGVTEFPSGKGQPSPSPEQKIATQQEGYADEYGVFIGVTIPAIDSERQPE